MKHFKKLLALVSVPAMLLSFAACGGPLRYDDETTRPEIETPEILSHVVYPEKPAQAPAAPAPGAVPSVKGYSPSTAESAYTVKTTEAGTEISYKDISDWAYVYVPVENYSAAYGNLKISLENGENAAERIAVQAIYYEAYDLGYAPVTVFLGELSEGEQYVIAELGEFLITDAAYKPVAGQSVKDKTVIGFAIFFDSLPSYAPASDASGSVTVKNFEFLSDGDPKLDDRYVKPVADFSQATADEGITLTKGETLEITSDGAGTAYIPVSKYSADFAKFTVSASGTAVIEVGVRFTLDGGETSMLSTALSVTLTGGEKSETYDYTKLFAVGDSDDITTQYVKDGLVTDIYVKLPASATVTVTGVGFIRTAADGAFVSNIWTGCSSVNITRAANGGNAKLELTYYDTWNFITVPVRKGNGVQKIVYTIYAPDGLNHIGFGLSSSSSLSTQGQNAGNYILRGSAGVVNGASTQASDSLTAQNNLGGVTETIVYDAATKIYTFTYDFTAMQADSAGKTFEDYTVTSLLFYLNCPDSEKKADRDAHKFEGVHNIYFLGIGLYTE